MNKWFIILILFTSCTTQKPMKTASITIEKQGSFSVGGITLQREGIYDNSQFDGWANPIETGQSYRADHAFVNYQIAANANKFPMIFVHGYGGSGVCWEMTPDNREGFATLMLRKKYSTYVMDLPGRGRAGKTSATLTIRPKADEMLWFDIWRLGEYPNFNKGVQFPQDSASVSQFFREMTPNIGTSDPKNDIASVSLLADKIGANILVTHSAGGITGWYTAIKNSNVKAIVSYEPGAYLFPVGEVPEPMPSLTGELKGVAVSMGEFKKLTQIPIVIYFGDYIPETVSTKLGNENWRVRLQMGRKFVETINRHGGKATLIELPKIGIRGNTHFLMSDLNNQDLANILDKWLIKNNLK